jgi:hypothetical protein
MERDFGNVEILHEPSAMLYLGVRPSPGAAGLNEDCDGDVATQWNERELLWPGTATLRTPSPAAGKLPRHCPDAHEPLDVKALRTTLFSSLSL